MKILCKFNRITEYIYIIGDDCNVGVTIWAKGRFLPVIGMKKNFFSPPKLFFR